MEHSSEMNRLKMFPNVLVIVAFIAAFSAVGNGKSVADFLEERNNVLAAEDLTYLGSGKGCS